MALSSGVKQSERETEHYLLQEGVEPDLHSYMWIRDFHKYSLPNFVFIPRILNLIESYIRRSHKCADILVRKHNT